MTEDNTIVKFVWPLVASLAGSVTALSLRAWEGMSPKQIVMAMLVSAGFAYFVGPGVIWLAFKDGPIPVRAVGAIYWVMASGSNVLVPLAIKRFAGKFETHDGDEK